jgi:6,7-dimethyl-8-ribityllumazine synthase
MTSSDLTRLPEDAIAKIATLVGRSLVGGRRRSTARVAVAGARFNGGITLRLLDGVLEGLAERGIAASEVTVAWVPGAFELPLIAHALARSGAYDAVICLGAVIRGDTPHFDYVAGECAAGIRQVSLDTGIPVVFGVLTTDNIEQTLVRSEPGPTNKGYESALTALEMVDLLDQVVVVPHTGGK